MLLFFRFPDKFSFSLFIILPGFKSVTDTGLQIVNWWLNEKGIRYPSRKKVKEDAKDPWGAPVEPGKYNLVMKYGSYLDSTTIEVKTDPRVPYDVAGEKQRRELWEEHAKTIDLARNAMEQLIDARETIKRVETHFGLAEDSIQKKVKKVGKKINDSIVKIQNLFMQAEGLKGYQDNSRKLNTYLYNATSHIGSVNGAPTSTTRNAVKKAKEETDKVVEQINGFFKTKWKEYEEEIAKYQSKLFKEYDDLKRE